MHRILLSVTLVLFGALSATALAQQGVWGIIAPHSRSTGAGQVFADLVISLTLSIIWMAHDATGVGRNPWPWIALTLAAGSFGPPIYLLTRKPAVTSASAAGVGTIVTWSATHGASTG